MRERLAKALFDAFGDGFEEAHGQRPEPEWDAAQPALREEWYRDADALLEEAEPVAWKVEITRDGGIGSAVHWLETEPDDVEMMEGWKRTVTPLYTSPTPTQATRARVEELEGAVTGLLEVAETMINAYRGQVDRYGGSAWEEADEQYQGLRALTSQEEDDAV